MDVANVETGAFSISATVSSKHDDDVFKISVVYGPTNDALKNDFFDELVSLKPQAGVKWVVLGDFNKIRRASDKNNLNINRSRINRFRNALHSCELKEIRLQNRRFTWSNERASPTMSSLDAFFWQ